VEKAKSFVEKHMATSGVPAPKMYGSYDEVYADPDVDIVYIATPHTLHLRNTLDAIKAGKHVLCEKPIAVNAKDTEVMIAAAQAKGVFLMEGELL
jgi:dihydrodiol dehydrogenase / D-xylose 1-dehydrogenase (NADP)